MLSGTVKIPENRVACLYSADEEMKLVAWQLAVACSPVATGDHVAGVLISPSPEMTARRTTTVTAGEESHAETCLWRCRARSGSGETRTASLGGTVAAWPPLSVQDQIVSKARNRIADARSSPPPTTLRNGTRRTTPTLRPRRGSAPASGGRRPRGRTVFQIPTGWTVFQIPSTPGSIPSVQFGLCGWDNSEIASYFTSFSPSLAIPARQRRNTTRGAGDRRARRAAGDRLERWSAGTERSARRSSLLTAVAASGRP